ncbi:glycerol channel [Conoideocrella luteorostrata]|uniref:Glycerol channel n=1 Tax=Conoideocrella luteorostrata TaxID=1105319 RepID=A0AAJ0CLU1_9HYPO|nr:glycerol channel [Conoideocrella luteorostrata]
MEKESSIHISTEKLDTISQVDTIAVNDPARGSGMVATDDQPKWHEVRSLWQDAVSEFLGTTVLILFGLGGIAQVVLSKNKNGDYQSSTWGFGIGVMLGAYVADKSGGHLNPAITLAFCVYRGLPWRKFPVYLVAQLLGAMTGAVIVYVNYMSAIDNFEGGPYLRTVTGPNATAGIFATYPTKFMTQFGMFFSEFLASTILQFNIFALVDHLKIGAVNLIPLGLFFLVIGLGTSFGWETGAAINLARDLGPRLVTYLFGYGTEVFSAGGYYFWVCIPID